MCNDVLQRLTGNLPALEPDVILDVRSAQCPQRLIGQRCPTQEVPESRVMLRGGRGGEST